MKRRLLLPLVLTLPVGACGKSATPVPFDSLIAPVGEQREPACTRDNDGKRLSVQGALLLPRSVTVENDLLSLDLYASADGGEGKGRSVTVLAEEGRDITFELAGREAYFHGGTMNEKAAVQAAKLRGVDGELSLGEPLSVTLEAKVLENFASKEISACTYRVVELRKAL
jgi:hypothetical protein